MSTSGISGGTKVPPAPRQENSFSRFISRFATPLTAGLFLISAISGTALFFHWAPGTFHEMHEWLSLVLLAAFAFHLYELGSAPRLCQARYAHLAACRLPGRGAALRHSRRGGPQSREPGVQLVPCSRTLACPISRRC